jgi:hypothetical protein
MSNIPPRVGVTVVCPILDGMVETVREFFSPDEIAGAVLVLRAHRRNGERGFYIVCGAPEGASAAARAEFAKIAAAEIVRHADRGEI